MQRGDRDASTRLKISLKRPIVTVISENSHWDSHFRHYSHRVVISKFGHFMLCHGHCDSHFVLFILQHSHCDGHFCVWQSLLYDSNTFRRVVVLLVKWLLRVGMSQNGQNLPCFCPVKRGLGRSWELFILTKYAVNPEKMNCMIHENHQTSPKHQLFLK